MPYPPFITILLSELPKAQYTAIYNSDRYLVTYEAALRILKVTQAKDHEYILLKCLSWNKETKAEQHIQEGRADNHCEISSGVIGNQFSMSVNRESDTDSVYLTLYHDRELVQMDIQLP
jgi:hypothetical protein|tara:strand:+ start:107 stop:463 length:357 start_codon:yes stop_codon:yes gene_type:complete